MRRTGLLKGQCNLRRCMQRSSDPGPLFLFFPRSGPSALVPCQAPSKWLAPQSCISKSANADANNANRVSCAAVSETLQPSLSAACRRWNMECRQHLVFSAAANHPPTHRGAPNARGWLNAAGSLN